MTTPLTAQHAASHQAAKRLAALGLWGAALMSATAATGQSPSSTRLTGLHSVAPPCVSVHRTIYADFDGDSIYDVLELTTSGPLLARSADALAPRGHLVRIRATLGPVLAGAVGDLNGDGRLDVFVAAHVGSRATTPPAALIQQGDGSFAELPVAGTVLDQTRAVAIGDVDGDGDLDVYAARSASAGRQDALMLNDGTGQLTVSSGRLPGRTHDTRDVCLVDFDGDGDLDVIKANHGQPDSLYENDGSGNFRDIAGLPQLVETSSSLDVADADGDGDLDVLIGTDETVGPRLRLLLQANRVFTDSPLPAGGDLLSCRVRFADLDGDGDLDLVRASGTDTVAYEATPSGYTVRPISTVAAGAVAVVDVDDDGDLDVVAPGGLAGPYVVENRGGWQFEPWRTRQPRIGAESSAVGDLDGDGVPEIVASGPDFDTSGARVVRVLESGGDGHYDSVRRLLTVSSTGPFALGDFDGDGDLDLLSELGLIPQQGIASRIHWNDGTGAFPTWTNLPATTSYPILAFAVADFDGDGDLDAITSSTTGATAAYRNDGNAVFTVTRISGGYGRLGSVALGDLDGDGDLDVVMTGSPGSRSYLEVLRNDGAMQFAFTGPGGGPNFESAVVADLDGDGDDDIAASRNGSVATWLQTPGGLVNGPSVVLPRAESCALAAGDVDGDGLVDLVLTAQVRTANYDRAGTTILLRSLGSGQFQPVADAISLALINATSSRLVDVDADGDLDLLRSNGYAIDVAYNHSRELAWRGRALLGGELDLAIRTEPGAFWALGLGIGPAVVPLEPFGTLRLGGRLGGQITIVESGIADTAGHARSRMTIPNNGSLLGTDWRAQALSGITLRLGSAERIPVLQR